MTNFMEQWGRYQFRTAPQGGSASGDAITRRYDDMTIDIEDHGRIVDDTFMYKMENDD